MNTRAIILLLIFFASVLLLAVACKHVSMPELFVEPSSCNGCGECIRICPNDAIYYNQDGKAEIDQTKCTNCKDCVAVCPNSAIY